jgi:hypothetical protein
LPNFLYQKIEKENPGWEMAGKFDLEHKVRDRELLCRVRIENEAALVMPKQPCSKSLPRVKIW